MVKFINAKEAAEKVFNGCNLFVSGNLSILEPESILYELEQRFLHDGTPNNLNLYFPVFIGSMEGRGIDYFAHKGFVKRLVGGSYASMGPNRKMNDLIFNNEVEAYNIPMGSFYKLIECTASGQPGLFTGVGLKTHADPRYTGGKLNSITKEEIVEVRELDGKEWLYYRRLNPQIAIIRGTSVDESGNISLEKEPTMQGVFDMALAAKQNKGIVIAQVRRKIKNGALHPRMVQIPSQLVDYVVLDERDESSVQNYPDSILGTSRVQLEVNGDYPLDHRKAVVRRIAFELKNNSLVNLGFGIAASLPKLAVEEGILDKVYFTTEHGSIGGAPGWTGIFAASANPQVSMDSPRMFDLYTAGLLDMTCLGMGEVDSKGNVNNHKFKNMIAGAGGFNDITFKTPTVIFAGTFTAGGLKTEIKDGRICILQEGRNTKFKRNIEGITFNADEGNKKGQHVLYITERAVFELTENGLLLKEIAPGIDLERQILNLLDFEVQIDRNLKEMDSRIFQDKKIGLNEIIN